jgi:hypothetical protein
MSVTTDKHAAYRAPNNAGGGENRIAASYPQICSSKVDGSPTINQFKFSDATQKSSPIRLSSKGSVISVPSKTQGPGFPGPSENPALTEKTEKQKNCPHSSAEVVTLTGGITVCNHCYDMHHFLPGAEAA